MNSKIPSHILTPLPQPFSLEAYKERLLEFSQWSADNFTLVSVRKLVHARSTFVDFILLNLWQHCLLHEDPDVSLLAVGGYGRGELHPESDIDLLILSNASLSKISSDRISELLTILWDLQFDVGHSVRTIDECIEVAGEDITVATNLMERRLLCGNKLHLDTLEKRLVESNFMTSKEFFIAKRQEQETRHARYFSTSYNLEPNIKANPGSLRDLQTIAWVAKKHFNTQFTADLVKEKYLLQDEYQEMVECRNYLWQMRFALHLVAGKNENRLLFDYQPAVAERMGFGDDGKAAVERMMKRFFRVARRVTELNTMLLQRFNSAILGNIQKIEDIDDDFAKQSRSIMARHNDAFFSRANIIKMFIHIANNPEIDTLHSDTIRLLRRVRRRLMGDLQDLQKCRAFFMEFLRHPNALGNAFSLMIKHSVLANYMPNWRQIVGQMQFDLFHAYTVDEHTHRLLKNIHRFSQSEFKHEFPLCSEIYKRLDKPELLTLAGLFHDIGKGRGGDHSKLGAIDANHFGKLHRLPASDTHLISWLVENHLLMSITAQKNDIYDPTVIADFAKKIKNETRLDNLYCLTVADVRATNSNLWNEWKNTLLSDLYLATQRALRQGLENAKDMRDTAKANKEQAIALLEEDHQILGLTLDTDKVNHIWKQFRTLYFSRHSAQQLAWHTAHLLNHTQRSKRPLVWLSQKSVRGGTQVFVYAKDQPGLFANIVSVFHNKNVNVVDAHIMNTKDGYLIDTFIVLDHDNQVISSEERRADIQQTIEDVITGKEKIVRANKRVPRQIRQFNIPVRVRFVDAKSNKRDMMELTALDTPGLLAKIANVFKEQKILLYSAKISTNGEKAEDIFKISTSEREKLSEEQQNQLVSALKEAIN